MKCEYCEIVEEQRGILYQDEEAVVAMKETGMVLGQLTVFPRQHFTILEQMPDGLLQKCASLANKAGIAVFEGIGCKGTNILVQNGVSAGQKVPHVALEIIPRNENDALPLSWEPQPGEEDELAITLQQLNEEFERKDAPAPENAQKAAVREGKDNYLLKQLKRMP